MGQFNLRRIADLYGVTDGKAVGTYVEQALHEHLSAQYSYRRGSSASGVDFPELGVDLKITSVRQPQSSCPYREASQKVYGLGYSLLVLVYDKQDDPLSQTARLNIEHAVFVSSDVTGDYQTTYGLAEILRRGGNQDDILGFLEERNLPLDDVGRLRLAERILNHPPRQGYLTISNALQWRLQYSRIIQIAIEGGTEGVDNLAEQRPG
jgi:restriction system protein